MQFLLPIHKGGQRRYGLLSFISGTGGGHDIHCAVQNIQWNVCEWGACVGFMSSFAAVTGYCHVWK